MLESITQHFRLDPETLRFQANLAREVRHRSRQNIGRNNGLAVPLPEAKLTKEEFISRLMARNPRRQTTIHEIAMSRMPRFRAMVKALASAYREAHQCRTT